jgi:D-specific alpha-keto acid dehydrogenase
MAVRGARASIQRTDVHDYRLPPARARDLADLVVGIVGMGRIGRAVADRLRGFGCRILTCDNRSGGHVPLDDLLRRSDVVTLHTPLTATTRHLLDRRRIELLKPGAYVVNTARGALLDTPALLAAVESGRLAGAALDVVEEEDGAFYADGRTTTPVPILERLRELPGVVLTPHTAFHTERTLRETVETTLINCVDFEGGRA